MSSQPPPIPPRSSIFKPKSSTRTLEEEYALQPTFMTEIPTLTLPPLEEIPSTSPIHTRDQEEDRKIKQEEEPVVCLESDEDMPMEHEIPVPLPKDEEEELVQEEQKEMNLTDTQRCIAFLETTTHTKFKPEEGGTQEPFDGWIKRSQTAAPEILSLTIHPFQPMIPVLFKIMDPCDCRLVLSMDDVQKTKRILANTNCAHMCLVVTSKESPDHPIHIIPRSAPVPSTASNSDSTH